MYHIFRHLVEKRYQQRYLYESIVTIVTINLTKAEIAYNSSGSDFDKWLRNTLLLTFITTIKFLLSISSD